MPPYLIEMGTETLLSRSGVRWLKPEADGFLNYGFYLMVGDTLEFATECAVIARYDETSWRTLYNVVLFRSDVGNDIVLGTPFSSGFDQYGLIPLNMGVRSRLVTIASFRF